MMSNSSFKVFYRTSSKFCKGQKTFCDYEVTLQSLRTSFDEHEIIIICDNVDDYKYNNIARNYPYAYRTKLGNCGSFALQFKLTQMHTADYYYFVEDDHLHLPGQKKLIVPNKTLRSIYK